jgi:N-acetyl-gamma-glutamyl-phosphate reductase
MSRIKAGIAGGAGYTGGELIRILLRHPNIDLEFVQSTSQAGKPVYSAHPDLIGESYLHFTDQVDENIDVLFLCMGHGDSATFLAKQKLPARIRIVDLSQDFRDQKGGFVYGLPELQKEAIKGATKIANPGCFATAIQLAMLPLAYGKQLTADIHVSAVTGSTGAGQSLSETTHFSWRSNNISVYKAFTHQHLKEIGQSLKYAQPGFVKKMHFVPYRGNFTRGILAACYTPCKLSTDEALELYREYYAEHPFVHVSTRPVDVKQVVNTNKCIVNLEKHEDQLFISTVIDNLVKGASGQAVQNMNLMFDLDESAGLHLKPSAF